MNTETDKPTTDDRLLLWSQVDTWNGATLIVLPADTVG